MNQRRQGNLLVQDILSVAHRLLDTVYSAGGLNIKLYYLPRLASFDANSIPMGMNENIIEVLKYNKFEINLNFNCHFVVANETKVLMNILLAAKSMLANPIGLAIAAVVK